MLNEKMLILSFFVIKHYHHDISENSRSGGEEIEKAYTVSLSHVIVETYNWRICVEFPFCLSLIWGFN